MKKLLTILTAVLMISSGTVAQASPTPKPKAKPSPKPTPNVTLVISKPFGTDFMNPKPRTKPFTPQEEAARMAQAGGYTSPDPKATEVPYFKSAEYKIAWISRYAANLQGDMLKVYNEKGVPCQSEYAPRSYVTADWSRTYSGPHLDINWHGNDNWKYCDDRGIPNDWYSFENNRMISHHKLW